MRYLVAALLCLGLIGCKSPGSEPDNGRWWVTCKQRDRILFDEPAKSVTSRSNGTLRIHIKSGTYFYISPGDYIVTCREFYNKAGRSIEEKWD